MIYKKIVKVICLSFTLILMIGVCGCMEKSPKFSTDDIIRYMNEKYGVTFTYIGPVDANQPTATSLAIFLEEPTHPGKRIFAKCVLSSNTGEKSFSDNYTSYLYEEDTRSLLTSISTKVYPDAKIRYAVDVTSPSSYSGDSMPSFEEYISRTKSSISFMILLSDTHDTSTNKEEAQKLCSLLMDRKVACSVTIAYAKEKSQYENFVTDNWENTHEQYRLRGDLRVGESNAVEFEEWR